MFIFSYRSFRNHLDSNLEKSENAFLMKTFCYAAGYFSAFGLLVFLAHLLFFEVLMSVNYAACVVMVLIGFCLCFPLQYFSIKYRNNPLRVPSTFVHVCFSVLTFAFMLMLLGFTGILALLCNGGSVDTSVARKFVGGAIVSILISSSVVYAIPVFFGMFVQKKKVSMTLNKFLNSCYLIYFIVFVIVVLILCCGFGIKNAFAVFGVILLSGLIFCGPVLTIYRLKTVSYYINHDDKLERKRWENYFAFEIAFQLMKIAFCVLKVLVLIAWRTKTRLK